MTAVAIYRPIRNVKLGWDRDGVPLAMVLGTEADERRLREWIDAVKASASPSVTRRRIGTGMYPSGTRCAYCLAVTDNPERDHVVPFSQGGADSPDNMVPACRSCNARKHDSSLLTFLAVLVGTGR